MSTQQRADWAWLATVAPAILPPGRLTMLFTTYAPGAEGEGATVTWEAMLMTRTKAATLVRFVKPRRIGNQVSLPATMPRTATEFDALKASLPFAPPSVERVTLLLASGETRTVYDHVQEVRQELGLAAGTVTAAERQAQLEARILAAKEGRDRTAALAKEALQRTQEEIERRHADRLKDLLSKGEDAVVDVNGTLAIERHGGSAGHAVVGKTPPPLSEQQSLALQSFERKVAALRRSAVRATASVLVQQEQLRREDEAAAERHASSRRATPPPEAGGATTATPAPAAGEPSGGAGHDAFVKASKPLHFADEDWAAAARAVPLSALLPSEKLQPRFRKGAKVGEGTFGEVCTAWDRGSETWTVLKMLKTIETTDAGVSHPVVRELMTMKALSERPADFSRPPSDPDASPATSAVCEAFAALQRHAATVEEATGRGSGRGKRAREGDADGAERGAALSAQRLNPWAKGQVLRAYGGNNVGNRTHNAELAAAHAMLFPDDLYSYDTQVDGWCTAPAAPVSATTGDEDAAAPRTDQATAATAAGDGRHHPLRECRDLFVAPYSCAAPPSSVVSARCPNVLPLTDVQFFPDGRCVFVLPLLTHDLPGLLRTGRFPPSTRNGPSDEGAEGPDRAKAALKYIVKGLLTALQSLHDNGVVHRDIKMSNVLVNDDARVVLCDFGWARFAPAGPLPSPLIPSELRTSERRARELQFGAAETDEDHERRQAIFDEAQSRVVKQRYHPAHLTFPPCSLNYRPLEVYLGHRHYDPKAVDVYGVGCIMYELVTGKLLFPGSSEADVLRNVAKMLGTPPPSVWASLMDAMAALPPDQRLQHPDMFLTRGALGDCFTEYRHADPTALDLVQRLLAYDWEKRPTAAEALRHPWFTDTFPPAALDPTDLPRTNCYRELITPAAGAPRRV